MTGIISSGAYIPLWRLSRKAIADGSQGEKAMAGFDEDSITMAVGAAMDCLRSLNRQEVDGLFFATTTSPFKEKLGATVVATAAGLRRDIITTDFSNSLRAGTSALRAAVDAVKSGSAKQVLVVAADCRTGEPGSIWELNCGDGAVAFLIGNSAVIAEIENSYSVCDEMMDVWRCEDDRYIRSSEKRFVNDEGYLRVSKEAITGFMKKFDLSVKDFTKAVMGLPDPRTQSSLAKDLGFNVKTQLQDSLFSKVGDTGAAYPLMLLQAALEEAVGNDRFLLVSYGNGSDAMAVKVNERIGDRVKNRGVKGHLEPKKTIEDYRIYLKRRGLVPINRQPPTLGEVGTPAMWREVDQNISLYGGKCKVCGTIQYPPQRVCTRCHSKDNFEKIRLSDKKGRLFTFSVDYVTWAQEMPMITAVVNLEGGGRIQCLMADASLEGIKVDMPVEMSFRRMDFREGIIIYCWKCVRAR